MGEHVGHFAFGDGDGDDGPSVRKAVAAEALAFLRSHLV